MLNQAELKGLKALRRILHQNAEISFSEHNTRKIVRSYLSNYFPDELLSIGRTGVAAVYRGKERGPTVLVRADMDGLPIKDQENLSYKSRNEGVSHKCGHDGHMAIVAGLAPILCKNRSFKGRVVLLFQPAEETGEGAAEILKDKYFSKIKPDYVFALHNLPGYKKNEILFRNKHFASASIGMIITLKGKTSHAAEPENGNSPALAMVKIISALSDLVINAQDQLKDFALITVIHSRLGEKAFGTTPGYAEVMATLRSYRNDDREVLQKKALSLTKDISQMYGLKSKVSWTEEFPATINDNSSVDLLKEVIKEQNLSGREVGTPFKWSEDFGHFTSKFRGILFGIGAGLKTPQLHNPEYDFPDDIISTGVNVLYSLAGKHLK